MPVDGCVVQCQLLWGGIPKIGISENRDSKNSRKFRIPGIPDSGIWNSLRTPGIWNSGFQEFGIWNLEFPNSRFQNLKFWNLKNLEFQEFKISRIWNSRIPRIQATREIWNPGDFERQASTHSKCVEFSENLEFFEIANSGISRISGFSRLPKDSNSWKKLKFSRN